MNDYQLDFDIYLPDENYIFTLYHETETFSSNKELNDFVQSYLATSPVPTESIHVVHSGIQSTATIEFKED